VDQETERDDYWDLFISYASEDKESFVRPLAHFLRELGLKVWYDEFTLSVGDSLSRSIDNGLARSRYGVVVISPAFLSKQWPEYELRGLVSMEMAKASRILPIWHNVSKEQVLTYSPTLADKVALRTSDSGSVRTALALLKVVKLSMYDKLLAVAVYRDKISKAETSFRPLSSLNPGPMRHERLSHRLRTRRVCSTVSWRK
jgi:hypothetical protein